jgi:hypothetical protein
MFPPRFVRGLAALCLALAACTAEARSEPAPEPRFHTAEDLPDLVLHADEAPEGTEFVEDASGTQDLERFWPTSCCLGIQAQFEEDGFQTAQVAVFEQPGRSADPVDTRPGWELVSSSAVLFLSDEGAATAMDEWVDYYRAPVLDPVSVQGLGEDAVGLAGSPSSPAERVFLYFWRYGRLVLALRVSTGEGTVSLDQVRHLVDLMNARAS